MTATDRLFDELLRPIVEDYEGCQGLATAPAAGGDTSQIAMMARLNALQECGDRTAGVLGVAEPLWDDMRALAGLPW